MYNERKFCTLHEAAGAEYIFEYLQQNKTDLIQIPETTVWSSFGSCISTEATHEAFSS